MAKYTKQDLYAAYAKHDREGLSKLHEPGTDLDCAVCDEINRITDTGFKEFKVNHRSQ